jgi:hypothetical protein
MTGDAAIRPLGESQRRRTVSQAMRRDDATRLLMEMHGAGAAFDGIDDGLTS